MLRADRQQYVNIVFAGAAVEQWSSEQVHRAVQSFVFSLMSWCQYCGENGKGIVPLAHGIAGHIRCFVMHNVFEVLNHGRFVSFNHAAENGS